MWNNTQMIHAILLMVLSIYLSYSQVGPSTPIITGTDVAESGQSVTFSCSVDSYPTSSFEWFVSSWLMMGNTSAGNSSELQLGPLTVNMSGVYTCHVFNDVTHQRRSAEKMLKVVGVCVCVPD